MLNFGNFLTNNAITFDPKERERKKKCLVCMKFCGASNAAIKNVKIARKKFNFFPKYFQQNRLFLKENTEHKVYFQILEVLLVILTTYLPV